MKIEIKAQYSEACTFVIGEKMEKMNAVKISKRQLAAARRRIALPGAGIIVLCAEFLGEDGQGNEIYGLVN